MNIETVSFRDMKPTAWDYPVAALNSLREQLLADEQSSLASEYLTRFLDSQVVLFDGVPALQRVKDDWTYFMRGVTFVSTTSPPPMDQLLRVSGESTLNLYGGLVPSEVAWETPFPIYTYVTTGVMPGCDNTISSSKRNAIRSSNVNLVVGPLSLDHLEQLLPEIIDVWSNHHENSFGAENGWSQLLLWRWISSLVKLKQAVLYCCWHLDGSLASIIGYSKYEDAYVYSTYWQPLVNGEKQRGLGTATLNATLPLLDKSKLVYLTCPDTEGVPELLEFERYKKKFANGKVTSYASFAAYFEAKPPYLNRSTGNVILGAQS